MFPCLISIEKNFLSDWFGGGALVFQGRTIKMNKFATVMLKMKIFVAPPLKMKKFPTYLMKINKFSEQNPPGPPPPQNIKWSSP